MKKRIPASGAIAALIALSAVRSGAADVVTTLTTDSAVLAAALQPTGLTILSVQVCNGTGVQIGTFANFAIAPVTSPDGIVLSSGSIAQIGPTADTQVPGYDPSSPPGYLSNATGSGATAEFTEYGETTGAIQNFQSVHDVACIQVTFELPQDTNVKFDFVFGSVEYPYWTKMYTDSFVAFLDTTDPASQVCYDPNGAAIQVGHSFATLVTTADRNTAFAAPHGMIRKLTTTTPVLTAGEHTLFLEVGDINDGVLDSAVFLSRLRGEAGTEGTGESTPGNCEADLDGDDRVGGADIAILLAAWGPGGAHDLDGDDQVGGSDLVILLAGWGPCS